MKESPPGVEEHLPEVENPQNKNSLISSSNWFLISSTVFNISLGQNSKWLYFASSFVCGDTSGVDTAATRHILVLPYLKGRSAATRPHLVLQIGNYVTLMMEFQLDTSGQISKLKGTQGHAEAKNTLWTAGYDVLFCPLKTKA